MNNKYPRISNDGRKPDKIKDGSKGYGKPCVVCTKSTIGARCIEVNYFRGDDEFLRVCSDCWDKKEDILKVLKK